MELYFWFYLIGAVLVIVAVPAVVLFLWRIRRSTGRSDRAGVGTEVKPPRSSFR
ncbi:hypothetical protein [Ornithinimicrobium cerasi]|uniref:hypothetical protein n=1 Tax=Ornithinimicrobium cerasi TaxID=2248773 RepID=UPI00137970E5|nr:hypothetical protein [Ornithinimicrobium cerasi]